MQGQHGERPGRHPAPRQSPRSRRRYGAGFWIVAYTFAVTMAFSAIPTPLYVLYQRRDHFGPLMVTVIFAAYAVGVVASLFLAGHVSDWLGRRRVVAFAVGINMASGLVFLAWPAVSGLIVARLISGGSIGMLTATATAHLSELRTSARPGAVRARADVVATAANLGGIGLGSLVSGLLAQYAGDPLRVPYLVSEALMLVGAIALAAAPETAPRPDPRPAYRPQHVSVPRAHRSLFFAAGVAAATEFALFGLFTSLGPGFIAGTLREHSHALAGFAAFIVFGAAAAAQIASGRVTLRRQLSVGLGAAALGLLLVTVAVWWPSLTLLLVGGVVAGGGAGAAFRGSVSTVIRIAPPDARAEALAGLFLAGYVGLSVPVLGLGVAAALLPAKIALLLFAAAVIGVVGLVSRRLLAAAPVSS